MTRIEGPPRRFVLAGISIVVLGLGFIAAVSSVSMGSASAAPAVPCNAAGGPAGCVFTPASEGGTPIGPLKSVKKPIDPQLAVGGAFIRDQMALVQLGKAFFWDQQAGSDGQACASCHFSAGADPRTKNQVSPGVKATPPDLTFQIGRGPNHVLRAADFPLHELADPTNRDSKVVRDTNDVVSSAGVYFRNFASAPGLSMLASVFNLDDAYDTCASAAVDPANFQVGGVNVRRVEPRNTPTMIGAAFNNRNFWDGRAPDVFNGVSPFGARDTGAWLYQAASGHSVTATQVRIQYASVASQSVGPPGNNFEMSCDGRTLPNVGHKLVGAQPLASQRVSPSDSVLGLLAGSRRPNADKDNRDGLTLRYEELIRRAFQPGWWGTDARVTIGQSTFSQMEANFSLFWGLSIQAYVETLVADETPVDHFLAGDRDALTAQQKLGLNLFQSFEGTAPDPLDNTRSIKVNLANGQPADARCISCHGGAETTNASISNVQGQRLERMLVRGGGCAIYDQGFLNTGVRPTADDINVAAEDPLGNSFAETQLARSGSLSRLVPTAAEPFGLNVTGDSEVVGPPLGGTSNCEGNNIDGAFKVPQLRNVELTGPYFHNGGQLTLMQVVDFYNRGGDFNNPDIDSNLHQLNLTQADEKALVSFLVGLTDERVAYERAPFDHPSLCVGNGAVGNSLWVKVDTKNSLPGGGSVRYAVDDQLCVPASGAAGLRERLPTFLGVSPFRH